MSENKYLDTKESIFSAPVSRDKTCIGTGGPSLPAVRWDNYVATLKSAILTESAVRRRRPQGRMPRRHSRLYLATKPGLCPIFYKWQP